MLRRLRLSLIIPLAMPVSLQLLSTYTAILILCSRHDATYTTTLTQRNGETTRTRLVETEIRREAF